jgi:hypothetical protein
MPLEDILTGKNGLVKNNATQLTGHVTGWTFEQQGGEQRFNSDKTSGHKVAFRTVDDFSATIRIKVPASGAKIPFNRGDQIVMNLHGDTTGNNYIGANAVVLTHGVPCDIDNGENSEIEYTLGPRGPAMFHGLYWSGAGSSGP